MINRPELLKNLLNKLSKTLQMIHKEQSFSFDGQILTRQQMTSLFYIFENKGVSSVKEIAEFLGVTSGAVTQLTDSLVEKNLVKRETSQIDRRSVNIKLMPEVEKDFNNFKNKFLDNASKSFAKLSDEEIEIFMKLVDKIQN